MCSGMRDHAPALRDEDRHSGFLRCTSIAKRTPDDTDTIVTEQKGALYSDPCWSLPSERS